MSTVRAGVTAYWTDVWQAWNQFWFTPTAPATLSAIRFFAGAMLFYTHLVWTRDLYGFFGPNGWLPIDLYRMDHFRGLDDVTPHLGFTIFEYIQSPALLWTIHIVALVCFFMLMIGLFSRTTAVLSAIFAIMYATRVSPGAYFGLDKVNCMLALYLTIGPCGARYSLDRLWRMRRGASGDVPKSSAATVAVRLMQLHLCAIYLYSGLGKFGDTWWTGEAIWLSVASLEYQSLNVTWLGHFPWLMDFLAHATVFFELFYCFLIWPRFTRPWMLATAFGLHAFIALCMGMITFGIAMMIANLAFVYPQTMRKIMDPLARRVALLVLGDGAG